MNFIEKVNKAIEKVSRNVEAERRAVLLTKLKKGELMNDGFHKARGFSSGYSWNRPNAVAYGSATLQRELSEANRRLENKGPFEEAAPLQAAVERVRSRILQERRTISELVFYWDCTWEGSKLVTDLRSDKASFVMSIDLGFTIAGIEEGILEEISLFPTMGVTVRRENSNYNNRIAFSVNGNVASIKDLWENGRSYKVRAWFDDLRYTKEVHSNAGDTSWSNVQANVLSIQITDTRKRHEPSVVPPQQPQTDSNGGPASKEPRRERPSDLFGN